MTIVTNAKQYQVPIKVLRQYSFFGFRIFDIKSKELFTLCKDLFFLKPRKVRAVISPENESYMVVFYSSGTIKLTIYLDDGEIKPI